MKIQIKHISIFLALPILFTFTTCLEEPESEFDVIGAVGTISVIEVSNDSPAEGEQIEITMTYFSERVAVRELRLNATVGSGTKTQVSTKTITNFSTSDSYVDEFVYTIPAGSSGEVIELEGEIVTTNDLVNSKSTNITVQ